MNINKTFVSSFLAVLLLTSFVLAIGLTVSPVSLKFVNEDQAHDVTITNGDEVADITISNPDPVTDGTTSIDFSLSDTEFLNVPADGERTLTVTLNGNPQDLEFGKYSSLLTITALSGTNSPANSTSEEVTLSVISSFCTNGAVGGNLSIRGIDIKNKDGDDDTWELLNEIEIEVEVENIGDEKIQDVFVELGLYDSNGNNVADDLDFENTGDEEIDVGSIKDDDKEKALFKFRVPADFDDGTYLIAVKAYSDDLGEDTECTDFSDDLQDDYFESVSIDRESDEERFVVVDDITLNEQVTCGETVSGSFTVFNIGDEVQEKTKITMISEDLDLNQEFEISNDLEEGDDETISFFFTVPEGSEEKTHTIKFRTYYDYNKGVYREISEDTFTAFLEVIGCEAQFQGGQSSIIITASLGSDAKAGEELVVTATITNFGADTANVVVDGKGFQNWAELSSVSPRTLTLAPGQSNDVTFRFNVNEDASGSQSFVIETNSNGRVDVQEVEVNIAETTGGVTGFAGFDLGEGNGLIWLIVIINVILIILIVIVAVRLSRR